MDALGHLLFVAAACIWMFPQSLGRWIADVERSYRFHTKPAETDNARSVSAKPETA